MIAGSVGVGPKIQVPFRSAASGNSLSQLLRWEQNKIPRVPQCHEYENPQVCLALPDLFRVKGIPAGGKNMSSQFFGNLKAPRELYLQADGSTPTPLAGYEQVHPTVLCGYPNVVFVPKASIDVVPHKELTFVDGEYWFHLISPDSARAERTTYLLSRDVRLAFSGSERAWGAKGISRE